MPALWLVEVLNGAGPVEVTLPINSPANKDNFECIGAARLPLIANAYIMSGLLLYIFIHKRNPFGSSFSEFI
jgi:hypothetical protein